MRTERAGAGSPAERALATPRFPGSKAVGGARNTSGIARESLSQPYGAGIRVPEGTPWAPTLPAAKPSPATGRAGGGTPPRANIPRARDPAPQAAGSLPGAPVIRPWRSRQVGIPTCVECPRLLRASRPEHLRRCRGSGAPFARRPSGRRAPRTTSAAAASLRSWCCSAVPRSRSRRRARHSSARRVRSALGTPRASARRAPPFRSRRARADVAPLGARRRIRVCGLDHHGDRLRSLRSVRQGLGVRDAGDGNRLLEPRRARGPLVRHVQRRADGRYGGRPRLPAHSDARRGSRGRLVAEWIRRRLHGIQLRLERTRLAVRHRPLPPGLLPVLRRHDHRRGRGSRHPDRAWPSLRVQRERLRRRDDRTHVRRSHPVHGAVGDPCRNAPLCRGRGPRREPAADSGRTDLAGRVWLRLSIGARRVAVGRRARLGRRPRAPRVPSTPSSGTASQQSRRVDSPAATETRDPGKRRIA